MTYRSREALLGDLQESEGPPGASAGVRSPSWRADRVCEVLPEGGRLFQRVGRSRKAFPEGLEGSGGRPGGLEGVGSPSGRSYRNWEAIPEGPEGSGGPPGGRNTILEGG